MIRSIIAVLTLYASVSVAADATCTNGPATNTAAATQSPASTNQQVLVVDGKTYERATLLRHETSGFVIMHSGGIVTLPDAAFLRGDGLVKYEKDWLTPGQASGKLARPQWTPTFSSSFTRDSDRPWRRQRPTPQPVDWGAISRELGRPVRSWEDVSAEEAGWDKDSWDTIRNRDK